MKPVEALQAQYWSSVRKRRTPDHPAVVAFAEPKTAFVRSKLSAQTRSLLEVGAGSGHLSVELAKHFDLTCLDYSENMLERNPVTSAKKVIGQAEALPFADRSFDAVLAANLLHHVPEPIVVVREMARVARHHVILLEPNAANPLTLVFSVLKRAERGALKFRRSYLEGLGERAQLKLKATSVQGAVPPNLSPSFAVPMLRRLDASGIGLYCVCVFDVGEDHQATACSS